MYKNLRRHATRHEPSPAGLVCCPVPGCLYANTRLDKIKAHAERHRSGKPVRSLLRPRVRRTTPVPPNSQQLEPTSASNLKKIEDVSIVLNNETQQNFMLLENNDVCMNSKINIDENFSTQNEVLREEIVIVLPPEMSIFTFT
jgi:hypothetical protein